MRGRPPGLSGWACGPPIVMKTPPWGRPSACGGLSGRPDGLSITYGGFSTVRGSSRTRSPARKALYEAALAASFRSKYNLTVALAVLPVLLL